MVAMTSMLSTSLLAGAQAGLPVPKQVGSNLAVQNANVPSVLRTPALPVSTKYGVVPSSSVFVRASSPSGVSRPSVPSLPLLDSSLPRAAPSGGSPGFSVLPGATLSPVFSGIYGGSPFVSPLLGSPFDPYNLYSTQTYNPNIHVPYETYSPNIHVPYESVSYSQSYSPYYNMSSSFTYSPHSYAPLGSDSFIPQSYLGDSVPGYPGGISSYFPWSSPEEFYEEEESY